MEWSIKELKHVDIQWHNLKISRACEGVIGG